MLLNVPATGREKIDSDAVYRYEQRDDVDAKERDDFRTRLSRFFVL